MRRLLLFAFIALSLTVARASAQSLGDVAKREEARRKAVTAPGKVYTGDSLRPESAPSTPPAAPPATGSEKASPAAAAPSTTVSGSQELKKDEAYWRQRIKAERDALDRSKTFADALQSRINGLTADFAARDDPFQRSQIGADRQKALSELDRVKKEIVDQTKAIADTQEEARKAGVPAGWVR